MRWPRGTYDVLTTGMDFLFYHTALQFIYYVAFLAIIKKKWIRVVVTEVKTESYSEKDEES